jgi:hypothetical protein
VRATRSPSPPTSPGSGASRTSPRSSTSSSAAPATTTTARATATAKGRLNKEAQLAQAALARYATDEAFRHLYDRVADTFAELLKSDIEHLRAGDTAKIGLEAKWCPSLRSSYDRSTLLCEAIARRIFPRESNQEYLNLSNKHYTYRVHNQLRREVLVPLRKVLELLEVYMNAGKWDDLP